MVTRRTVLTALAGGVCAGALSRSFVRGVALASHPVRSGPYFLRLTLGGGPDSIYGLDPKVARDVAPGVNAPILEKDIVRKGEVALGPHLATLAPFADRMTVLRGVLTSTAAHTPGLASLERGQRGATPLSPTPTLDQIIGEYRESQPMPTVALGNGAYAEAVPSKYLSQSKLESLLAMSPDDLASCAKLIAAQQSSLKRRAVGLRDRVTLETMEETRRLFDFLAGVERPVFEKWVDDQDSMAEAAKAFQFAHWLFKHDLSRSASIFFYRWDSHAYNADSQASLAIYFDLLRRFLDRMSSDRNHRPGSLLDNTLIFASGELGRFPYLNPAKGKHHFPEVSCFLMGPGLKAGSVYGTTGREMEALPMDWKTGRPSKGGGRMTLDDLGATILKAAGVEPRQHAYAGRVLDVIA